MPIFEIKNSKLKYIEEKPIKLEKDIQKITEENLGEVFGLKLIASEFALQNFRIDTLAFNEETNSFVIIEYKRDKNFSVIDQGYSYLGLMLNNKADFILEYNEKSNSNLKRGDVDWSQSKVLFVANSFTNYQRNSINFKDLPIELWEVKLFQNNIVSYNPLKAINAQESVKTLSSKDEVVKSVSKEVKQYSLSDHLKWEESKELFEELSERILAIDSRIEEVPTKTYIGYKIGNFVIFDLGIQKTKIRVNLYRVRPKDLSDPEKKLTYLKNSMKHWNKHVSYCTIENSEDIDYAMMLIKELYKKFFDKK
jgi:predicted transport protein